MAEPKRDRMEGIRTKLSRAKEIFECLDAEALEFIREQPFRIRDEHPKAHHYRGVAVVKKLPPVRWAALAGDVIHNLRSALDHIAWQLVQANGNQPRKSTEFPVFTKRDEYGKTSGRFIGGVSPQAVDLITALQPFNIENPAQHPLKVLHDLNRRDKHRLLKLAAGAIVKGSLQTIGSVHLQAFEFQNAFPLRDGAVVVRAIAKAHKEVPGSALRAKIVFDIVFDANGTGAHGKGIKPILTELLAFVQDAVDRFEPLIVARR